MCGSYRRWVLACSLVIWSVVPGYAGVRVKDITFVDGVRPNLLYGFGLVVGLDGTGSKSLFTQQVAVDMLQKLQVSSKVVADIKSDNVFKSGNIAAVMVTAELGPFQREGSRVDVTVSVLDDSTSIQGGTLLLTPLRGVDGEVYVVAQGPVSVGGFTFSGRAASAQKNHPTVGRIAGGGIVEKEARSSLGKRSVVHFVLSQPDFRTAKEIERVINERYGPIAMAVDGGTVAVRTGASEDHKIVELLADIGSLEVWPDAPAKVVINERTGTVVAGEHVKISTVAIAHGNLAITVSEEPLVSQPPPLSRGETTVVPRSSVGVAEQSGNLHVVPKAVTVGELARALNALGVTPRDLISIFQALKEAGALHAELVIM